MFGRTCSLFLAAPGFHSALRRSEIFDTLFKLRYLDDFPIAAFVPRTAGVALAFISLTGRIVEVLVDQHGSRRYFANRKRRFPHALESSGESLHVSDLSRHQELKGVLRSRIVAKVD